MARFRALSALAVIMGCHRAGPRPDDAAGTTRLVDASVSPLDGLLVADQALRDPTVDLQSALRAGLRAWVASAAVSSRASPTPDDLRAWPAVHGGDLRGSDALSITVTGWVERRATRTDTRSCEGRPRCTAIGAEVHITNRSARPATLVLRDAYHGGALLPSWLFACTRPPPGAALGTCAQVYLLEPEPTAPERAPGPRALELAPGGAVTLLVRLDWQGTGSLLGTRPLVDPVRGGAVPLAVAVAFRSEGRVQVAYSQGVAVPVGGEAQGGQ
ncbi:MAG: hypothetical protein HY909_16005 [Deltaproteobacteria bacterium]|nr:hypothetical protein [Deltaproteobacteria bacterium]